MARRPATTGSAATPQSAAAATLYDETGYTPSQVTAEPVCGAAAPGTASCASEVLVTRSTHAVVHPLAESRPATPSSVSDTSGPAAVQVGGPALYTPAFLQEAYDTGWLSATAGVGQTVAIVDAYNDPAAASDLATFRSASGLPAISPSSCTAQNIVGNNSGSPCLVEINQQGNTSPLPSSNKSWASEESLDLDAVSSLCPECNILFIEANSSSDSDLAAADAEALKLGVKLISNSFVGPDSGDGDYFSTIERNSGDDAGAETFAATGDDGAYIDDGYQAQGQTSVKQAPYPASEPGITAVGGTTLDPATGARGITELAWSGAGSACSTFDSQPSWQASANTGCSGRATADVSADADPNTGLKIYDSYGDNGWAYYGGTSLAAPLTAAYVALTNVNSTSTTNSDGSFSAQWAYADAGQLNDVTSGSNGSGCSASIAYAQPQICNAGSGWDGPTGVGSISGDVLTASVGPSLTVPPSGGVDNGGNGFSIVQSLAGTTATFDGGVYPNGSATNVWWEYGSADVTDGGTDFSSAEPTPPQSVGSGTAPVAATPHPVSDLTPGEVYYVEECASNSGGADTTCGNETQFTTGSGPDASGAATITATNLGYGGQISLSDAPTWTGSPTISYQWQESADGATNWSDLGSATTTPTAYTLQVSDSQQYVRLEITATAGGNATTDYSNSLQAQAMAPQTSNPTLSASGLGYGDQISVPTPTWTPAATTVSYQWQESTNGANGSWNNLGTASTANDPYTIQLSDSRMYIRSEITATNTAGSNTVDSNAVQVSNLSPAATGSLTLTDNGLEDGDQISLAGEPTWSPGSPSVKYQWQESPDGSSWTSLGNPSGSLGPFPIGLADSKHYIRAEAVATDVAGTTTVYSAPLQVQNLAPAATAPIINATSLGLGGVLSFTAPSWSPEASDGISYQWQTSVDGVTWSSLGSPTSTDQPYTIVLTDSLRWIRVAVTGTNGAGPTTVVSDAVQIQNLAPVAGGALTISSPDSGLGGVIGLVSTPTWSPASSQVAYRWQESPDDSSWSNISGATSATYTIQSADSRMYIRLAIVATDAAGTTTAYSNSVQVQDLNPSEPPGTGGSEGVTGTGGSEGGSRLPTVTGAVTLTGAARVGGTVSVHGGFSAQADRMTVTFKRCAHTCTTVQRGHATRYKLRAGDAGYFLVAYVAAAGGAPTASGPIGPIASPQAGSLKVTGAAGTVRSSEHQSLVSVRRALVKPKHRGGPSSYKLTLTRAARLQGSLSAWACLLKAGRLVSCTRAVRVTRSARLSESVATGETVEVIALR